MFWFGLDWKLGVEVTCWFCSSQSINHRWFLFLPPGSVNAWVTLSKAQSQWLSLLSCETSPGIPPHTYIRAVWCEMQAESQAPCWRKLWSVETWDKIPLKLHCLLQKHFQQQEQLWIRHPSLIRVKECVPSAAFYCYSLCIYFPCSINRGGVGLGREEWVTPGQSRSRIFFLWAVFSVLDTVPSFIA